MNVNLIPKMIELWLLANVGALLVLAVLSYVASKLILDGLEFLDRWLARPNATDPATA